MDKEKPRIYIPEDVIKDFCLKNHISKLALFGSVLTDNFRKNSDVDILVEFDSEHIPGLLGFSEMECELSEIMGRRVDFRTPKELSRYFRDEVISKAYHLH